MRIKNAYSSVVNRRTIWYTLGRAIVFDECLSNHALTWESQPWSKIYICYYSNKNLNCTTLPTYYNPFYNMNYAPTPLGWSPFCIYFCSKTYNNKSKIVSFGPTNRISLNQNSGLPIMFKFWEWASILLRNGSLFF